MVTLLEFAELNGRDGVICMVDDQQVTLVTEGAVDDSLPRCELHFALQLAPHSLLVLVIVEVPELYGVSFDSEQEATRHQVVLQAKLFNLGSKRANPDRQLELALQVRRQVDLKRLLKTIHGRLTVCVKNED